MPLEILEDAFHLLRQLPASAWVTYLTGAVPFLLAVLFAGMDAASIGYTPARAVGDSVLCAALFVWMQVWKARFACEMRAQLSAVPAGRWTFAKAARGLAIQCSLQSLKLVAVPLAALTLIPFAWTIGFFRNVTALAMDEEMDAGQLLRLSARFATLAQRSGWVILSVLAMLALFILLNFTVLLAVLPGLMRSFTGMENAFTRGTGKFFNFALFGSAAGLTSLVLDPLLQAVYTRLSFLAQSRHTGVDLLAALRRLAPVLVMLGLFTVYAPAEISAGKLNRSIDKVLQERSYSWKSAYEGKQASESAQAGLWRRFADGVMATGKWVRARIQDLEKWIRDLFREKPEQAAKDGKAALSAPLRWSIYVLLGMIAAGLIAFLVRSGGARVPAPLDADGGPAVDLAGEQVAASDLPEDGWMQLARECIDRGEHRLALRALYLANLAHLGSRELVTIAESKTNRDYERELRRRSRSAEVNGPFHQNRVAFEGCWYGDHPVAEQEIQNFERNFESIRVNREA